MEASYFYREHGRVIGPISWENLQTLCRRQSINPTTEVRNNDGPWIQVREYPSLLALFPEPARVKKPISRQHAPQEDVTNSGFSLDDLVGPKKPQALTMASLVEEASSHRRLKEKTTRSDEDKTSYWSLGVVVVIGLAAHGAIVWNYSAIFAFVRDLVGIK